jgi:serine protease Do
MARAAARVAKLYGVGGVQGLEANQSALVISSAGLLLTVDGVALDTGEVTVVFADGERRSARLVAADPVAEVALLETVAWPSDDPLPAFDLRDPVRDETYVGATIGAISNAFGIAAGDEPPTLQRGVVSVVAPLDAYRTAGPLALREPVLLLDAVVSNPGAAGGAIVDDRGRLLGMIGKEARGSATGAWLNFALPTELLARVVERLQSEGGAVADDGEVPSPEVGERLARAWGLGLAPNVARRTPPYIERIDAGSPAEGAGLRVDDLLVAIDGRSVSTIDGVISALAAICASEASEASVRVTALRGPELIDCELPVARPRGDSP